MWIGWLAMAAAIVHVSRSRRRSPFTVTLTPEGTGTTLRLESRHQPASRLRGLVIWLLGQREICTGSYAKSPQASAAKAIASERVEPWNGAAQRRLPVVANFTVKNLKEVEDSAANRGPDVEARFGRKHLDSQHLGVSYFRYGPGYKSPVGHRHREQEEAYVIVGGSGRMRLDDEIVELREWDAIRVAPDVVRAFEAGPDGLELIAIGSDRPEGGDGERVDDFWPD